MFTVKTLNGKIDLQEYKLLYKEGSYVGYLYVSCQNDRDFADMKLNRDQVKSLIAALEASLLWGK